MPASVPALLRAGRGRLLPLCLLVIAALLLSQIEHTPLASLQAAVFDRYQRLHPRPRGDDQVIVVGIDSASLVAHGQWPWPRDLLAALHQRIQAGNPLAIGLDIILAERDRYSPASLAARLPGPPAAIGQLPDPDAILATTLAQPPATVLAVAGLPKALPGAHLPAHPLPVLVQPPAGTLSLPRFVTALSSLPVLQSAVRSEGLVNTTPDQLATHAERGILRRVPMLALINEQPYLSLGLEMVRQALGDAPVAVERSPAGQSALRLGDYRLPVQDNGEVLLHFGRPSSSYYLSAADVLAGTYPPETFTDRFVLVGLNSTGLQDRIITPLGDNLPGIDVHVQVIESLLQQTALRRPAWMPALELGSLMFAGLLLISMVPALRPKFAAFAFAGVSSVLVGSSYLAFRTGGWLFDGPSQSLLLAPVFMALLANTLIAADARRRQAEARLQQEREAAARLQGELDAARRIQMGLLPDPQQRFAGERRFSVGATLDPALAVGGDYYDCFMIDERRLCIAIGDVSGKGLPASLFMAMAKTLGGTLARRHDDPAAALRDLEQELSRENPAMLFVTAFMAIVDVDDGRMVYVCAGHDAPFLLRDGQLSRLDIQAISGPPLCCLGDFPYTPGEIRLQAGDLLCLFTDGASEAWNGQALFGVSRLAEALHAAGDLPADQMAIRLRDGIRRFEAGQAPADDLTLLLFRWYGQPLSEC